MIPYKLRDWIPLKRLSWVDLSANPRAGYLLKSNQKEIFWHYFAAISNDIDFLEENLEIIESNIQLKRLAKNPNAIELIKKLINTIHASMFEEDIWYNLSFNPNAIPILENNLDKVNWYVICQNPNAISILENNLDKINWKSLSVNPNAIELLEQNLDKINWEYLSLNPNAIHLLEKNPDKINWDNLSKNHNAINLLKKNKNKINWDLLSKNPNAIQLLEENLDKINWSQLTINSNAIYILEKNKNKIVWKDFTLNPAIFTYDYEEMKENYKDLKEDIIKAVMHPSRIQKYLDMDVDIDSLW